MKIVVNKINNNFLFEGKNSSGHKVLLDNKSKKEGEIAGISPMELLLNQYQHHQNVDGRLLHLVTS